jgi:catechol 2,3-dioxygenase-like lactoylglutathione lyase family enzyme
VFLLHGLRDAQDWISATFEKPAARLPGILEANPRHRRSAVIQRQSHSTVYVIDQQESLEFYRDTLGFEVRMDMPMNDERTLRWVTVSPKGQPDLEMVLMPITPGPTFDAETAERMKKLVENGALGIGVFETDDIHGDYERLGRQGVEFLSAPQERPYGIEAVAKDNSGNWFSLTQRQK